MPFPIIYIYIFLQQTKNNNVCNNGIWIYIFTLRDTIDLHYVPYTYTQIHIYIHVICLHPSIFIWIAMGLYLVIRIEYNAAALAARCDVPLLLLTSKTLLYCYVSLFFLHCSFCISGYNAQIWLLFAIRNENGIMQICSILHQMILSKQMDGTHACYHVICLKFPNIAAISIFFRGCCFQRLPILMMYTCKCSYFNFFPSFFSYYRSQFVIGFFVRFIWLWLRCHKYQYSVYI